MSSPTANPSRFRLLRDRRLMAWAMYDWANSAYTTLLITVLVAYIQRVVFPVEDWEQTGAVVWAWGIALSMFLGAILSPVVGAMADARRNKKQWLAITAMGGAAASILLGIVPPSMPWLIVALFVVANLGLELSLGIYNGFLPEIAEEKDRNAASAIGYALGYFGGGVALLIAMGMLFFGDSIGLPTLESQLRAGLILMGLWWGVFTLPALMVLSDPEREPTSGQPLATTFRQSGREVLSTIRSLRTNTTLACFLLAFLFYNDGIQTVISQASTFALQELNFTAPELMGVILMIQFVATPGALIVAKCADRFGKKSTLWVCLAIWCAVLITALFLTRKVDFWMLAIAIALVMGGTQSVSRSLMADLIPEDRNAQYFGFFNLSGKATSFLGTFFFGAVVALTGSARLAIVGLVPLFLVGAAFLWPVREEQGGREELNHEEHEGHEENKQS